MITVPQFEAQAQHVIARLNTVTPLAPYFSVPTDVNSAPSTDPANTPLIVGIIQEFLRECHSENDISNGANYFFLTEFLVKYAVPLPPCCSETNRSDHINMCLHTYTKGASRIMLPSLVLDQDQYTLRTWADFCFFVSKKAPHKSTQPTLITANTEEYLSVSCTANLDIMIAHCLLENRKPPVVFLLREICKGAYTMQQIIKEFEAKILKVLVNEIGYGESSEQRAIDCIKMSAVWRNLPESEVGGGSNLTSSKRSSQGLQSQVNGSSVRPLEGVELMLNQSTHPTSASEDREEAARLWMKPHVMFLMVQIIDKWNIKDVKQRRHALRCFCGIVRFLHVSEAALYLPKIMSCVSIGMGDKSGDMELRFLAVKGLSDYVRTMCESAMTDDGQAMHDDDELDAEETNDDETQVVRKPNLPPSHAAAASDGRKNISIIGRSLATIIVALFPILQSSVDQTSVDAGTLHFYNMAVSEATSLIHFLVFSAGEKLLPYLSSIPFLPRHPELVHVREQLKAMGIDFDELSGSLTDNDSSKSFQAMFQWRLKSLVGLMGHENVRVRQAVTEHLSSFLKENRRHFVRLIDSEQSSSNRFLTVVAKDAASPSNSAPPMASDTPNTSLTATGGVVSFAQIQSQDGGLVSALITAAMTRCWKEPDDKVKLALATLLGEIGAIDSKKLGLIQSGQIGGSSADGTEDDDSDLEWRANEPPWKSSMLRYALQLLCGRLVVALKGGITSQDQDKVGFAIQEVLKLCQDLGSGNGGNENAQATGMSKFLSDRLEKCNVLHVVEPFWTTSYVRSNTSDIVNPPFFATNISYPHWIAKWCRFLANKAKNNSRSCWNRLFVACDSTMRAASGVGVAEFLLPLLVLDVACFGDKNDGDDVVTEMELVLRGGKSQAYHSEDGMGDVIQVENKREIAEYLDEVRNTQCTDDHRRAVNTVFTIMETLEAWADAEVEERYKIASTPAAKGSSKRSRGAAAAPPTDASESWPSDEGIERIQAISAQITLQIRADAAIRVGAHARAVKYLEMHTRMAVVEYLYDSDDVSMDDVMEVDGQDCRYDFSSGLGAAPVERDDVGKMQMLLGALNDVDGMKAFGGGESLLEQIFHKEVCDDWGDALMGYEQALILHEAEQGTEVEEMPKRYQLQKGLLRCLLQVGSLEMVLNQVGGMLNSDKNSVNAAQQLLPSAMEAAWRLQRWTLLDELLDRQERDGISLVMDNESAFQIGLGKAMSALHKKKHSDVLSAIDAARMGLMGDVANAARESFSRSSGLVVKLQALREVEFAADMLCTGELSGTSEDGEKFTALAKSDKKGGWDWDNRLELMGHSSGAGVNAVVIARLATTKMAMAGTNVKNLEGDLWMSIAKRARKLDMVQIAQSALSQARRAKGGDLIDFEENRNIDLQLAKVQFKVSSSGDALKIIETNAKFPTITMQAVAKVVDKMGVTLGSGGNEDADIKLRENFLKEVKMTPANYGKRLLVSTEWMVQDNLKHGSEIKERYLLLLKITPTWEKSHFYYARYLDGLFEARVAAVAATDTEGGAADEDEKRRRAIKKDRNSHVYLKDAVEYYIKATEFGDKHIYRGFPRLLSLWFEFNALKIDMVPGPGSSDAGGKSRGSKAVAAYGKRANSGASSSSTLNSGDATYKSDADRILHDAQKSLITNVLMKHSRIIPPHVYYTALPQLISRIKHPDANSAKLVQLMLRQTLAAYPLQAMWSLAWLKNSNSEDRREIVKTVFDGAGRDLGRHGRDDLRKVLLASDSLMGYLKQVADYVPNSNQQRKMTLASWKGDVKLHQFLPPVQAALSVNLALHISESERKLRMDGKAEVFPAYVPRMSSFSSTVQVMSSKAKPKKLTAHAAYIDRGGHGLKKCGEMHFLVKKEEKGDLRKDSRVQDLNNVLNRILNQGGKEKRKMSLRTFCVTCLSEDTGLLEWVPNTESLRSLIQKSYNPQAHPDSVKRRGQRLADFTDARLRGTFLMCQNHYVESGNLALAASSFEKNCLRALPPVLYWYFVKKFADPHEWFEARTRFTLSVAVWSAVGHVIGLGDRHTENILLDVSTGEVVHVDFDCLFDKGLKLARPEVVPFRLTANMVDVMGAAGYEGAFRGGLVGTMSVLRDQRELLLAVLQPFILDPIIQWKSRNSSNARGGRAAEESEVENEAGRKNLRVIDGRLRGVYNLVNPNLSKISRTDGHVTHQEDDDGKILPLGVEGQCAKLITEATKSENLAQMVRSI
jgi:serine/threonine-protein kinase ATR